MPIKPENKKLYPKNWKNIRAEILQRAHDKCEFCGVDNHAVGARDKYGNWHDEESINYMPSSEGVSLFDTYPRMVEIVLTIAHLDHNPQNNEYGNLRALCQKCHNSYDAQRRAENARITRMRKNYNKELL